MIGLLTARTKYGRRLIYLALAAVIATATFIAYRSVRTRPRSDMPTAIRTAIPTPGNAAIAVLPFVSTSDNPDDEYFSDGVTEDILNALLRIPGLRVAARSSAFAYKNTTLELRDVARNLGAQMLLQGSVRKAGDNIRIAAQLMDTRSGSQLWSNTYDRQLKDIFAVQEDIVHSISDALELRLDRNTVRALERRPTPDPQAYDLYLRGRQSISGQSRASNDAAVEYLRQAIARDPDYALAYAALARAHMTATEFGSPRTALPEAKKSALRALELDSSLLETRLALARVRQVYDRDWASAEKEIRRGIELDPNSSLAHGAYGELLLQMRRHAEAERERLRSWELRRAEIPDTLLRAFRIDQFLSWGSFYLHAGQSERALDQGHAITALDPDNAMAHWIIATALQQMGRYDEALEAMKIARASSGVLSFITQLGRAYALAGQRQHAEAVFDTLRQHARVRHVPKDQIALLQLALGDTAHALASLDTAIANYEWFMPATNGNPAWRGMWGHPGFEKLMRKLGAPADGGNP